MMTKFMVASLWLLLLTTGSFAGDKDAPEFVVSKQIRVIATADGDGAAQVLDLREIGEGEVYVVSLDKLDAAGAKLSALIEKLEASGDVTAKGADKLNALIEKISAKLGAGADEPHGVMMMHAPSEHPSHTKSVNSYVLKLSGDAAHEGQAHGFKVISDMDQLNIDGVMNEEIISKIRELKEIHSNPEELAIEIRKLFDAKAGEHAGGHEMHLKVINLANEAEVAAQAYVVRVLGDEAKVIVDGEISDDLLEQITVLKGMGGDHENLEIELKMLYEGQALEMHKSHGEHGELRKIHKGKLAELTEKHECKGAEYEHGEFGALHEIHEGKLTKLHEKLKSLESAEGHGPLGHMSSPHPPVMLGMTSPHKLAQISEFGHSDELDAWFAQWETIMEELAIDLSAVQLDTIQNQLDQARDFLDQFVGMHGAHGMGMMTAPGFKSAEGRAYMFSEDGNISIPGLPSSEEFEMMWIGEDGELSFDVEELMVEIEKLVQELVEKKQAK